MNWLQKIALTDYPLAGSVVGGLTVLDEIDNTDSISASFYEYEILPGIREVPMSDFGSGKPLDNFYAANDIKSSYNLSEKIRQSQTIMPLIITIDNEGPYILEGGHRFVALHLLGISTFPALIVIDQDKDKPDSVDPNH